MKSPMNKVALVTGGVGGIGTGISKALAAKGFTVVANYLVPNSEQHWLDEMAVLGLPADRYGVALADVTDIEACAAMVAMIEARYGPVAVLVNCAGITRDASFRKMTLEQWRAVMATNLDSVFNVTKQVIDGMCERGFGRIISISSVNGVKGAFGQTNYAAAKAGILGFTKSLALEVSRKGVTVNAISPGFIDTDMTRAIPQNVKDDIVASIPSGRMGDAADIANAVAFLASDEASYITGANLSVNGGVHLYQ